MSTVSNTINLVLLVALVLVLIAIGPLITIWAWNTLFGSLHEIPWTFETWLATICLAGLFRASGSTAKKS